MTPLEATLHTRKKIRQLADSWRKGCPSAALLEWSGRYPQLPNGKDAPSVVRDSLARDAERSLSGRWRAFRHLELRVDDPPRWHTDYLCGKDLMTTRSAFRLNHRGLPDGADIKLIWELSRWHELVRLAMAAYVLNHPRAAAKCLEWLEDWVQHNQPYRGWNWTSALEAGIRLIQFTWIYALLHTHSGSAEQEDQSHSRRRLAAVAQHILPAHTWFTWRYRSFGSSANNHLIGELAGLILATVAWPALAHGNVSLDQLQREWEHEVLAQFNQDGGNREQALNYQLFSWELCWQARAALRTAGRTISPAIDERLRRAARFYVDLQVPHDPWDYGDSDGAIVTPTFADERNAIAEWHKWLTKPEDSPAVDFWWQAERVQPAGSAGRQTIEAPEVIHHRLTGHGIWRRDGWTLRMNASPLGYLKTAAHGHCDPLQISLWHKGVAVVVDPGTGSYYQDEELRAWLASAIAHNGPCSDNGDGPQRLGTFLWATPYAAPALSVHEEGLQASVCLRKHTLERTVRWLSAADAIEVEDRCRGNELGTEAKADRPFTVLWQFGPGARLQPLSERSFLLTRKDASLRIDVSCDWSGVDAVVEKDRSSKTLTSPDVPKFVGTVSSSFRRIEWAPYLKLTARPEAGRPCAFRTMFRTAVRP